MKLLKPIEFQTAQLVSSNAVETYPTWSSATTYAKDAYVDYGTHIYQSLVNTNLNNRPDISPTQWILIGPDNTHAMFDLLNSTQTVSSTPLNVTVNPGDVTTSAAFLNLSGTQLSVIMTDGAAGPTVYSKTVTLDDTIILDWYMYFFEPYNPKTEVILDDLPSYRNGRISMSLTGDSTVKIGAFIYGNIYELGKTQYGASAGIIDYSVKQTDEFGNISFLQRAYSKRMEANVLIDNADLRFVQRLLTDVRATPVVWIGSTESQFDSLVVFGFYKEFNTDISYPTYSLCRLTIEGLT